MEQNYCTHKRHQSGISNRTVKRQWVNTYFSVKHRQIQSKYQNTIINWWVRGRVTKHRRSQKTRATQLAHWEAINPEICFDSTMQDSKEGVKGFFKHHRYLKDLSKAWEKLCLYQRLFSLPLFLLNNTIASKEEKGPSISGYSMSISMQGQ